MIKRNKEECKCVYLSFPFKAEPKQSARFGKYGVYKDPKVKKYEQKLKLIAMKQLKDQPKILKGAVYYDAVYTFLPPKSSPKWVLKAIEEGKTVYKSTKPDLTDNLNKGIIDVVTPLFMNNDSQISHCTIKKVYGKKESIIASFYELHQ